MKEKKDVLEFVGKANGAFVVRAYSADFMTGVHIRLTEQELKDFVRQVNRKSKKD